MHPNLVTLWEKWFERVKNKNGDFCYIIKDTIPFWLHQKPLIKEFKDVGSKFIKCHVENNLTLVFTFGDGVKRQYFTSSWKWVITNSKFRVRVRVWIEI